MKSFYEIENQAKLWLKDKLDEGRLVFLNSEVEKKILSYFRQNQYISDFYTGYFFLKRQELTEEAAFQENFWKIIIQFLNLRFKSEDNNPAWYLTGIYSYEFLVDRVVIPELNSEMTISTNAKSNTILKFKSGFKIICSTDRNFHLQTIIKKDVHGDFLFLLKPEVMIINSSLEQYRLYETNIVSFLKQRSLDRNFIVDYFKRYKTPYMMARFLGALRQINDMAFFTQLKTIFDNYDLSNPIENPFSKEYRLKTLGKPAYISRFNISLDKAIERLSKIKIPRRLNKKLDVKDLEKLSVDDNYHSLTIEGYDVTKELIQRIDSIGFEDESNLKNIAAAKGFMRALNFIKNLLEQDLSNIDEDISSALWTELWSPSINAGFHKYGIDIYRKQMVAIRGSSIVPPSYEKIHYLLEAFFEHLNTIENGFLKGIFAHYFYVWIHPHLDGNGRISRFLMNIAFINDKYKWLTIPYFQREKYFSSLEKSQLDDDIGYFSDFILEIYEADLKL